MKPRRPWGRWMALLLVLVTGGGLHAFTARDSRTIVDTYLSAFYSVNGANAHFRVSQTDNTHAYFWGQAEMIECVIDAYEWTGDPAYLPLITSLLNGFLSHEGSNWGWNIYNDDIMWATLAFARGGVATGNNSFCDVAKANFDLCYARAWDNVVGGGLYWNTDNQTKNAASNGNAAIAAFLLYQIYGDPGYLAKANAIYNWERATLFNANTGLIADLVQTNGVVYGGATTYNQGTFIGAAHFLGHTNDARRAANFTMMHMGWGGVLSQYGIDNNNSGFNAIFLRWMTRFVKDCGLENEFGPWLQRNAQAAWDVRRSTDHLSWCDWNQPTPVATNLLSWDCISSFEALLAAEPTEPSSVLALPVDPIGAWPLDETNGTVAADISGSGNHGTVNGAAWDANGRFNGCLTFDGINDSVAISNSVEGDFSIVLWVRTMQASGPGQWFNGKGLVDGDVPLNNNDFGTALVDGKFAFGVGNPDTTILSTTSINDGAWHQCVATRQRYSGAIKVYVDGVFQASGTGNRNRLDAPAQLLLGTIASGGGQFSGSLDGVQLFNRSLGSDEVIALYQGSAAPPPAAPTHLTAVAGGGQVRLSWWEAPLATDYQLKRSSVEGGPYVTVTNLSGTTWADSGVLANRSYYYVVSAVNLLGESADSLPTAVNTSTLAAWLSADTITGLADGAPVAVWSDSSGHGSDAIQLLDASRPTYVTAAINGRPAVRFNSADSSYLWLYRPVQDDFTILLVYQSTQGIGTGTDFWTGAGLLSGEMPAPVNDFGISLNANGRILAGTGNPDRSIGSTAGFNDGQPHLVTFKRTRNTGTIILYVDGTPVAATSAGTQSLTSPNFLVLGGQGVLNNFVDGEIAEVQIHSEALSDAARFGLERALKCKYGLAGGVVPTPPTGLTALAGDRKVSLNWVLVPGATSYTVARSTNSGAGYQPIAVGVTTSSYVDMSAVSGRTNYYRVAAENDCGTGAYSAVVAAYPPLPKLGITTDSDTVTVVWPAWAGGWLLSAATNLAPPVVWTAVTNIPGSNGGQSEVVFPIDSQTRFFRLTPP